MILLDTDILTLYFAGRPQLMDRVRSADEVPAITSVSRIEVLQGRFASVLKASDGPELLHAQERLSMAERGLAKFTIIPLDAVATAEFGRLRQHRKLKKVGRADLLIASITLAHRAVLVTRNLRHFHQVPGLQVEDWAK